MKITFKAGERFFINGAVLRFSAKVQVELMNNAEFLLESHIIQAEQTTTPLRQLYFVVQTAMIDKTQAGQLAAYIQQLLQAQLDVFDNEAIKQGLWAVAELLKDGRNFAALKVIRGLFSVEQSVVDKTRAEGLAPISWKSDETFAA